jgi:hypothetical protein
VGLQGGGCSCQNWKWSKLVKTESGQNWRWSKLKVVKIKSGKNWRWSKLKVVKTESGQNWKSSKLKLSISISTVWNWNCADDPLILANIDQL